ncbi:hypothetical protein NCCP1664_15840 [Zafaria cholistanensis]|uniref:Uncharacterized protein n=1 Tax=Zafaria cholistanensis TaxID=1682741 RepID=A0A5A7NTF3_9MICC|nr:TMEM175 family protein [Zafaria cholistanensis]GER23088.1 hypothetical protein NCCP1664_15840 [Zafaria cholistanensis]
MGFSLPGQFLLGIGAVMTGIVTAVLMSELSAAFCLVAVRVMAFIAGSRLPETPKRPLLAAAAGREGCGTPRARAFAIILVVTNVDPPPAESWTSPTTLWHSALPNHLFGFLLSFAVIAFYWRVNFRLIGPTTLMNHRLISWNIVAAFFIVLIPSTTQGTSDSATSGLPLPAAKAKTGKSKTGQPKARHSQPE